MDNWPNLTCIFTTYNRKDFIKHSLSSILNQKYNGKLQIIVSDDRSTDGTFEILQNIVQNYKGPHDVIVIQTPKNGRLAANVNYALKYAKYEWIVRHDDDDIASPHKCEILGWAIIKSPSSLFIFSEAKTMLNMKENVIFPSFNIDDLYIDSTSDPFGVFSKKNNGSIFEAKCFSKKLWDQFGNLPNCAYLTDDLTFFLRARIQDNAPTVRGHQTAILNYHNSNSSGPKNKNKTIKNIKEWETFIDKYYTISLQAFISLEKEIKQFIKNNNLAHSNVDKSAVRPILDFIDYKIVHAKIESGWYSQCNAYQRFKRWLNIIKSPLYKNNKCYFLLKVLPLPLFAYLIKLKHLITK